jgi:hypothetical protein
LDGYEYETKVLFPKWNKEGASINNVNKDTKERLRNELGIEIRNENPMDLELGLANKLTKNPDNF